MRHRSATFFTALFVMSLLAVELVFAGADRYGDGREIQKAEPRDGENAQAESESKRDRQDRTSTTPKRGGDRGAKGARGREGEKRNSSGVRTRDNPGIGPNPGENTSDGDK